MQKIIECVPNFSEGRDLKKVQAIKEAIETASPVKILRVESDVDHNRSVITFAGEPEAVFSAAFASIKKAAELIDMYEHQGAHPRIGATDVCPFIPLKNCSFEECVELAHKLGGKVGEELGIPIYFYEKAAKNPHRTNLADVRRGEFEILKNTIGKNPQKQPDHGPSTISTAGATAIGVREILVAYNINLKTSNLEIAKKIAKKIREKDGGLKSVKALGLYLDTLETAQVSMNLTNYKETSMLDVFQAVAEGAKNLGTEILESEIIGLVPADALPKNPQETLKISNFSEDLILEKQLQI